MIELIFDIGATNTRYSVKESGICIESGRKKTQDIDLPTFIEDMVKQYKKVKFIGIAFAGQVLNNKIISSPAIKIPDMDIVSYMKEKYNIDVLIENDLKCAALAEYGIREKSKMLALLFIGSGIGSSYVYRGRLMRGADNLSGEIGHIYFKQAPFKCGCGKNTCVELFSSGNGIKKWFDYYKIEDNAVLDNLNRIDRLREVKQNFYEGLSLICSVIVKTVNPDYLVLGGGVIKNNPRLADFIKDKVEEFGFLKNRVKTEMSTLEDAPLSGAEMLSENMFYENYGFKKSFS